MCGIAGIVYNDKKIPDKTILQKMGDAIWHRGPDYAGYFVTKGIGFVHRRLSILDLSELGHQPMFLPDRSLGIVFNGEIYNYLELRRELEEKGISFKSNTDTEVVLWAYKVWGVNCFKKFNGMWAIVLWDESNDQVILSRDRFGVKPLYYGFKDNAFLFGSEAKALLASGIMHTEVDEDWMYQYIHIGYVDTGEETFFKGIKQFPAGHYAVLKENQLKMSAYWTLDIENIKQKYDYNDPVEQFKELLTNSVKLRLRSDVQVGSCLSGGLDSSTLVCLASNMLEDGKKMYTFSSIYNEKEYSEKPFVDEVVKHCSTNAHYVYPKASEAMEFSLIGTYSTERPCAGPTMISQLNVMEKAHEHVKVLIDGQGSDEFLAGYSPFFYNYLNSLSKRVKGFSSMSNYIKALISVGSSKEGKIYAAKHIENLLSNKIYSNQIRKVLLKLARSFSSNVPIIDTPSLTSSFFKDRMDKKGINIPTFDNPFTDEINNVLYNQFFRQSIPSLLITEDANSMAFSIEARTPFMDYRLVEFVFGLDFNLKINGSTTKYIQRQAMDNILPQKVRDRKDKKGYPTPYALWLRGPIKQEVESILFSNSLEDRGIFDNQAISYYWNMHQSNKADFSWAIYKVLSTELWYRIFIDKNLKAPIRNTRKNLA